MVRGGGAGASEARADAPVAGAGRHTLMFRQKYLGGLYSIGQKRTNPIGTKTAQIVDGPNRAISETLNIEFFLNNFEKIIERFHLRGLSKGGLNRGQSSHFQ